MKKSIFKLILVLFAIALFSGCNADTYMKTILNKMVPKEDDQFAREYLETIKKNDIDTAITLLSSQIREPNIKSKIQEIVPFLDKGETLSIEIIGCNVFHSGNKRTSSLTYQYQFKDSWLLASVTVENIEGKQRILGINVNPIPTSLKEINAFTFLDKKTSNYIFLIIAFLAALLILYSLILCIKTKMKKKWLWIILIFCGITKLNLNWTTGHIGFQPISISFQLLLGFSAFKQGLYAPWVLSTYLPLGAIIFLIRRKKLQIKEIPNNC